MERRPFTHYFCVSVDHETTIVEAGEEITIPAGGFICDVFTDDNRDTGYAGQENAHWRTWARNRAAFDRLVGVSRRGVLHDVVVELDGERIGQVPA